MLRRSVIATSISVSLFLATSTGRVYLAQQAPAAPRVAAKKTLPLAGETFLVDGSEAFLIPPPTPAAKGAVPWVWYAPTLAGLPGDSERWMFERFAAAGIGIAGIDVGESYGSPDGQAKYTRLYETLVKKRGFSPRPVLLGRSRGGLMLLCWACENADKVGGISGIYPVCNIASYPGVEKAAGAYRMTADELQSKLSQFNPPDRLESLAKAKVPLFAIHGDVDTTVPLEQNSGLVAARYAALSGKMELVVPKGQGHNMWPGFFESPELVAFVLRHARVNDQ
jgi:pimeloyl-ACP methyl ester carboxylesterase